MLSNTQRGRKIAGVAAALCLAASLCACQGGTHEEAQEQNAPAAEEDLAEEFAEFEALIAALPKTYTYTWSENYSIGEGGTQEQYFTNFVDYCDESGEEPRDYVVYGRGDSFTPDVEMYFVGDKVVRMDDGVAVDVTSDYVDAPAHEEVDETAFLGTYTADMLVAVTQEEGQTVYHFAVSEPIQYPDDLGSVEQVDSAEIDMKFDESGLLVQQVFEAEGTLQLDGEDSRVSTAGTVDFKDWGTTKVPTPPDCKMVLVGNDLTKAQDAAASALRALPANFSCESDVDISIDDVPQGTVHTEALVDESRAVLYVVSNGNEDDALLTFYQDGKTALFQGEELLSASEGSLPDDAFGNEKALALIEAADSASIYEQLEDGLTQYVLVVDPNKLPAEVSFDGVGDMEMVTAYYWVTDAGMLDSVGLLVGGSAPMSEGGGAMVVDSLTVYGDFGVTEVPEMPAV